MRALTLLAALALLPAGAALAGKPGPPMTYTKESADKRFVFVMIAPDSLETELTRWNEQTKARIKDIRTRYATSGLYKNDGSKEPLWTVDWYRAGVAVPADGVHLVRFGRSPFFRGKAKPLTKEALKVEGLAFFARGKLLREYSIAELVDRPEQLPRGASIFKWVKTRELLDGAQQFRIVTYDGNRVLFDLKTGKILKKEQVKGAE
jgi:hypothetical protein